MKSEKGAARAAVSAVLLLVLAVSGYAGADKHEPAEAVSVPVVFEAIEAGALGEERLKGETEQLGMARERALSMLEDVIRDPRASEQTVQSALMQKTQIAENAEKEAKFVLALEQLGIENTAAVMGEQILSVFAPEGTLDDKNRVQIVDMAVSVAGVSADCVKIILVKNE